MKSSKKTYAKNPDTACSNAAGPNSTVKPNTVAKQKKEQVPTSTPSQDVDNIDLDNIDLDNCESMFESTFESSVQTTPNSSTVTEAPVKHVKPVSAINSADKGNKSEAETVTEHIFEKILTEKTRTKHRNIESSNSSLSGQVSNLQALLNKGSISDMASYDIDVKANQIRQKGKEMLAEFIERGIEVSEIDTDKIIGEWADMKYIGCNPNNDYVSNLISSIETHGFESPRPIQSVTIGQIAKGGDIIVQAKAGNGKTAAFTIGAALGVDPRMYKIQALILSPTQLLTDQTMEVVKKLTAHTGITVHCYRGGIPHTKDGKTPHIVVGCPGRIKDLIKSGKINLKYIKTVILDEGDELLKQGFREQIKDIVESLAETVQICLFSATLPKGILELCTRFMRDPAYVILPENQVITELVTQWYVKCGAIGEKDGCIVDIIEQNPKETIIIFFNSCSRLQRISDVITKYCKDEGKNIPYLCVHGKMDPTERAKSIADFSSGKCRVLLASDMASRGLDIPSVTLVVNYDIPFAVETYVHRIGRSGRGDRLGNSVTLIMTDEDKHKMTFIVQVHSIPIKILRNIKMESKPASESTSCHRSK
jgi:superfamily II DNA/RNA helicase